jgi:hypothetical protein
MCIFLLAVTVLLSHISAVPPRLRWEERVGYGNVILLRFIDAVIGSGPNKGDKGNLGTTRC